MLSVSKTSVPFNFQLTVSRVYEEGDANILDEDDDEGMLVLVRILRLGGESYISRPYTSPILLFPASDADEKSFLIGVELGLRTYTYEGKHAFSWKDVQGNDPDDRFEFVADSGTTTRTRNFVEQTILKAVYERKYSKPATGVSDNELKALAYEYVSPLFPSISLGLYASVLITRPISSLTPRSLLHNLPSFALPRPEAGSDEDEAPVRSAKGKKKATGLEEAMSSLSVSKPSSKAASSTSAKGKAKAKTVEAPPPTTSEDHAAITSQVGDLYLWDFNAEQFNVIEEEVAAKVVDMGGQPYNCAYVIVMTSFCV